MENKILVGFVFVASVVLTFAYSIYFTVENESLIGAYVLGVLSTVVIGVLFWSMQLVSAWVYNTLDQRSFINNAKENLANSIAQQKLQNEQTRGALMLSDNAMKHSLKDSDDDDFLSYDIDIFDNVE